LSLIPTPRVVRVSPVVSINSATPTLVEWIPQNRRARIRAVAAYNGDTAVHRVIVGYVNANPDGSVNTASFTQILPDIPVPAGGFTAANVFAGLPGAVVDSGGPTITGTGTIPVRGIAVALEGSAAAAVRVVVEWEEYAGELIIV